MSLLEQVANALEDYTGIDEHHYQRAAITLAVVEKWLRERSANAFGSYELDKAADELADELEGMAHD